MAPLFELRNCHVKHANGEDDTCSCARRSPAAAPPRPRPPGAVCGGRGECVAHPERAAGAGHVQPAQQNARPRLQAAGRPREVAQVRREGAGAHVRARASREGRALARMFGGGCLVASPTVHEGAARLAQMVATATKEARSLRVVLVVPDSRSKQRSKARAPRSPRSLRPARWSHCGSDRLWVGGGGGDGSGACGG